MIRRLRQPKWPILVGGVLLPVSLGLISKGMEDSRQSLVNGYGFHPVLTLTQTYFNSYSFMVLSGKLTNMKPWIIIYRLNSQVLELV